MKPLKNIPELVELVPLGGLIRSTGGWKVVKALRKAKDFYKSDERILGSFGIYWYFIFFLHLFDNTCKKVKEKLSCNCISKYKVKIKKPIRETFEKHRRNLI
jgi:hypothetical protein